VADSESGRKREGVRDRERQTEREREGRREWERGDLGENGMLGVERGSKHAGLCAKSTTLGRVRPTLNPEHRPEIRV